MTSTAQSYCAGARRFLSSATSSAWESIQSNPKIAGSVAGIGLLSISAACLYRQYQRKEAAISAAVSIIEGIESEYSKESKNDNDPSKYDAVCDKLVAHFEEAASKPRSPESDAMLTALSLYAPVLQVVLNNMLSETDAAGTEPSWSQDHPYVKAFTEALNNDLTERMKAELLARNLIDVDSSKA